MREVDEPGLPGGPEDEILSWLWSEGEVTEEMSEEGSNLPWLASKVKEVARNQGMKAASRSWRRWGTGFSTELPENNTAGWHHVSSC